MPALDQNLMQGIVDAGNAAVTTTDKGRALEDLICYIFDILPGIAITHRNELNEFHTEEIDVALLNDGLNYMPINILVECKNWSNAVSSIEVAWFLTKLRNRGLDFGILVSPLGITGNQVDLTAANFEVASALKERRRLIIITTAEILGLSNTDELEQLIKLKICDLVVKGSIT